MHLARTAAATLAAVALTAGTAAAQAPSLGLVAGVNVATIGGDDVEGADNRTGLLLGVSALFRFAPAFGLQAEVLYAQKGAKTDFSEDGVGGTGTLKLDYVEVPILARLDLSTTGAARPFLLAGPAIAFNASCKVEGRAMGMTMEVDCDNEELDLGVESLDVGAVVGGGLEFPLGSRALSLGARYTFGLRDLAEGASSRNRALGLVAGLRF